MAKILIIEDERAIAELIRSVLDEGGHQTTVADTAHPPADSGFELVLTDLASANGYSTAAAVETVAEVRRRLPGIPVVVCTAHRAAQADALALGADAVICKPFDVDDLLAIIDRLVRRESV